MEDLQDSIVETNKDKTRYYELMNSARNRINEKQRQNEQLYEAIRRLEETILQLQ